MSRQVPAAYGAGAGGGWRLSAWWWGCGFWGGGAVNSSQWLCIVVTLSTDFAQHTDNDNSPRNSNNNGNDSSPSNHNSNRKNCCNSSCRSSWSAPRLESSWLLVFCCVQTCVAGMFQESCRISMSTWQQEQSYGERRDAALAGATENDVRSVRRRRVGRIGRHERPRRPEWDWLQVRHVQLLATGAMSHKKLGHGQRQVPGHRWKVPPCAVCNGNAAGTGDGEASRNTVRGSDGHHLQSEGRDQSETGRAAQTATSGQTTGRCEDSAHAGCCTLHQEEAGAGGDRDKGGPGEGDVASGVRGVPEVRAVGPTRPERPCGSYLRRTGQRGRQQEQLLRWM